MDITIHGDPEASLAFYRDTLGFEVRSDFQVYLLHGRQRFDVVPGPR